MPLSGVEFPTSHWPPIESLRFKERSQVYGLKVLPVKWADNCRELIGIGRFVEYFPVGGAMQLMSNQRIAFQDLFNL